MDRQTNHEATNSLRRQFPKPAAVCGKTSLQNATATAISLAPAESSTDQTEATLFALALAMEQRDGHTAAHCGRSMFISVALGTALGLSGAELVALYRGSLLHDVGKVGIPDSILFKPGKLTPDEWTVMRSHAARGEEICRHLKSLAPVLPIIRHHHERWDGSGYPDGLAKNEIPLVARLVQIADIYDALTNPRAYKIAFAPDEALKIIAEETSRGWRDPEVVDVFLRIHKDIIAKIAYYDLGPDRNLMALRNSLMDMQTVFATVA